MADVIKTDICVIGAGSGGLSVAAGAAQLGAEVTLLEKHKMGGDCLNYGCVPSKALIAAAHAADTVRRSGRFGVNGHEPAIDFAAVHAHVHGVIAKIEPHDSVERFEEMGVRVIQATGQFVGPNEVMAGDKRIQARRFVIATGSSPAVPDIPGIDDVAYLTNETIFELTEKPEHLIVIGAGPIGAEMAQAHRRLGAQVTLLAKPHLMQKDDPDAVAVVRRRLTADGIDLREGIETTAMGNSGNGVYVDVEQDGEGQRVSGSHVLVSAGRRPNLGSLNLEAAGVDYDGRGIKVDARLRSSNKRVFAIGDVAGSYQFTHMASYHAGIVIRNALFRLPAKVDYRAVPWVTYTDPELAHVGLSEAEARNRYGDDVKAVQWAYDENDRAQAERETEGFIKVVTGRRGRVLGATIVGRQAGELLMPWVLAIQQGLRIGAVAGLIAPYPTLSEISKRAAGAYFTPALFSDRTKKVVRALQWLG